LNIDTKFPIITHEKGDPSSMSKDNPSTHFITMLRHGKSQANEQSVLQGQMDSPLSEEGIQQSRSLAKYWNSRGITFDRIISSPLARAYGTARIISEFLSVPIDLDSLWMERAFGKAEGMLYDEILSMYIDLPPRSIYEPAYETGESDWDLYMRAAKAVQSIIYRPSGNYLIVSHGAILNATLSSIIGITPKPANQRIRFRFSNTGYAKLEFNSHNQNWSIISLNTTAHLLDLGKEINPRSDSRE
jgi:2,3-bisphosphoglycerate-dependent phosphoglycerate mutase